MNSRTMAKPVWIDTHIHVSDVDRDGKHRDDMAQALSAVLNQCDADLRLIVSPDDPHNSWMRTDPKYLLESNRMVHDLVRSFSGKVFGSCAVNPHFLDESLRVMDICFGEWGFVQLGEMLQYLMGYRMDSDAVEKLVRKAVEYDVPVQVHIGTYCCPKTARMYFPAELGVDPEIADIKPSTAGMNHLIDLLALAERVPEAKYILGHAIGCGPSPDYVPWANMILDTLAGVFPEYPENFWLEIRDFTAPALARTLNEVPIDRLLCGTDWSTRLGPPFPPYGTSFEMLQVDEKDRMNAYPPCVGSLVGLLQEAGATGEAIRRIGSQNACELYRLCEQDSTARDVASPVPSRSATRLTNTDWSPPCSV